MSQLSTIIEQAFEDRANFTAANCAVEIRNAVEEAIAGLDNGTLRVAEKIREQVQCKLMVTDGFRTAVGMIMHVMLHLVVPAVFLEHVNNQVTPYLE